MNLKQPKIRSEKHRRWIAGLPCLRCGGSRCQAAHVTIGRYGMGMKPGDDKCIPLCLLCHQGFDQNQRAAQKRWGIDALQVARDYWEQSPHFKEAA